MFNLRDIIENSVFYPASGIDGNAIKYLSHLYCSFIHVDYSMTEELVRSAMESDFIGVGYNLIGIKQIGKEELGPKGFRPSQIALNEHEKHRIGIDFIGERFFGTSFTPFALWAVYELSSADHDYPASKPKRFSLLHIGGEACATFEAIYLSNMINPAAVAIFNPGEGFGDNWTKFRDPQYRLYQSILFNVKNNGALMPDVVLAHNSSDENDQCFWPDYRYSTIQRFYVLIK
ncbi:hypothetical protein BA6E_102287 [Bacteroidales bacterium 6E]|nr:hypothetical protein BA6E_102287 [Bacteroidales bacterium 6E]